MNIFNFDETKLFCWLMPNKMLDWSETCDGGKHCKEWLTVVVCYNIYQFKELFSIVADQSLKTCLKNAKSKCMYSKNKNVHNQNLNCNVKNTNWWNHFYRIEQNRFTKQM